jgi:formylmethanofuran dehydrogenase subunit D
VSRKLYDRAVGTITSPALVNLATGASITIHPLDLERVGAAVGANVRISNAHSSIVLPVQSNEKVPRGTAVIPFNQPGADIRELVRHGDSVVDVRIESM